MSVDWPTVRLGDHVDSCLGKMLDKKKNKGTEQPYLGNSNVRWGSFDLSDLAQMKFEEGESQRYGIQSGDLIVCEGGEPGRCAIWNEDLPDMKIQKALHRVRTKATLNNSYLYYWFLNAGKKGLLEPYFTGTTIKHLTGRALNDLEIPLPPMEYQKFVARILGSLDNKIQLNRQINKTLEQIAQAIFKSWFVDFDPVKAKQAALAAGGTEADALQAAMQSISGKNAEQLARMETDQPEQYAELRSTAGLFPSAMQESELGEIPEGWGSGSFKDLCVRLESGGTPKRSNSEYWGGDVRWLSSGEVRNAIVFDTKEKITQIGLKNSSAKLWPKYTTVIAMYGATAGQVCLLADEMASNQACCGLLPKKGFSSFVYLAAKRSMDDLAGKASGSAQQNLNKGIVSQHPTIIPTLPVVNSFEGKVIPLIDSWISALKQASTLCSIRDTLLPRLLAGELALPDTAENSAELKDLAHI